MLGLPADPVGEESVVATRVLMIAETGVLQGTADPGPLPDYLGSISHPIADATSSRNARVRGGTSSATVRGRVVSIGRA